MSRGAVHEATPMPVKRVYQSGLRALILTPRHYSYLVPKAATTAFASSQHHVATSLAAIIDAVCARPKN
jgi:hypothetical protein